MCPEETLDLSSLVELPMVKLTDTDLLDAQICVHLVTPREQNENLHPLNK